MELQSMTGRQQLCKCFRHRWNPWSLKHLLFTNGNSTGGRTACCGDLHLRSHGGRPQMLRASIQHAAPDGDTSGRLRQLTVSCSSDASKCPTIAGGSSNQTLPTSRSSPMIAAPPWAQSRPNAAVSSRGSCIRFQIDGPSGNTAEFRSFEYSAAYPTDTARAGSIASFAQRAHALLMPRMILVFFGHTGSLHTPRAALKPEACKLAAEHTGTYPQHVLQILLALMLPDHLETLPKDNLQWR